MDSPVVNALVSLITLTKNIFCLFWKTKLALAGFSIPLLLGSFHRLKAEGSAYIWVSRIVSCNLMLLFILVVFLKLVNRSLSFGFILCILFNHIFLWHYILWDKRVIQIFKNYPSENGGQVKAESTPSIRKPLD